jgi:hypothetical protein
VYTCACVKEIARIKPGQGCDTGPKPGCALTQIAASRPVKAVQASIKLADLLWVLQRTAHD